MHKHITKRKRGKSFGPKLVHNTRHNIFQKKFNALHKVKTAGSQPKRSEAANSIALKRDEEKEIRIHFIASQLNKKKIRNFGRNCFSLILILYINSENVPQKEGKKKEVETREEKKVSKEKDRMVKNYWNEMCAGVLLIYFNFFSPSVGGIKV